MESPSILTSQKMDFAENVDFSIIVSDSERTYIFLIFLTALLTLGTLVQDIENISILSTFDFIQCLASD